MSKINKFFFGIVFIGLAILIPFYFDLILYFFVANLSLEWVFSSVLIRLIVIILFTLGIKFCFDALKPKTLKNWLLLLIGISLGFGCSFIIAPIYDVDYFMQNDDQKLEHFNDLHEVSGETYTRENRYELLAFLDVGCSYCMIAAQRMGINLKAGQNIPIHLFFNGEEADIKHFREKNGVEDANFHVLPSKMSFAYFAGFEYPSIFLINPKGEVEYHWVGQELNYNALDYLISLEQ